MVRHKVRGTGSDLVVTILIISLGCLASCGKAPVLDSATPASLASTAVDGGYGTVTMTKVAPADSAIAATHYRSAGGHFTLVLDQPWQMNQSNALHVQELSIDQPLILAVELIPKFTPEPVAQRPITVDGTPVANYLQEVVGVLTLHQVSPDTESVRIVFPDKIFDSTRYSADSKLLGWELRAILTSQIDTYPVSGGATLGKRFTFVTQNIPAQQTWIESEPTRQAPIGPPTDIHLSIPDSTAGAFLYYPIHMIMDSLTLSSDPAFDFTK
jgi:hypothetical protein